MTSPTDPQAPTPTRRTCSIPCCGKPHRAKGYCIKHWQRWNRHGDPLVVLPREGRPKVGEATREIRATKDRGPRKATPHTQVRLGEGQKEALKDHAARLVMTGAAVLRAAAARLLAGDIPPPTSREQIPEALPSESGEYSWIPGPDQLDQLTAMGLRMRNVLVPEGTALPGPRGGRPGKLETECRDALLRWALDQHLNPTED